MSHPEFLLVPLLMISDYVLTIAGARLREGGYAEHFRTQHYELNPIWQKAVRRARWLNLRHLALVVLVTTLFFAIGRLSRLPDDPQIAFLLGFVIGIQGALNGRHLGNLAIFAAIRRRPGDVRGEVTMSHELTLRLSMFQNLAVLLPLVLLVAFVPNPTVWGACAGVAALMLVHILWIARQRRSMRMAATQAGASDGSADSLSSSTASGTNLP